MKCMCKKEKRLNNSLCWDSTVQYKPTCQDHAEVQHKPVCKVLQCYSLLIWQPPPLPAPCGVCICLKSPSDYRQKLGHSSDILALIYLSKDA